MACDHPAAWPRGVAAQSVARIRSPISPPPARNEMASAKVLCVELTLADLRALRKAAPCQADGRRRDWLPIASLPSRASEPPRLMQFYVAQAKCAALRKG